MVKRGQTEKLFSLSSFYTIVVYTIVEFYKFEWRYIYGKVEYESSIIIKRETVTR